MNRSNWSETLRRQLGRLGKFKYPLLVLLLGMVLTYAGLTLIGKCSPTAEERAGGNRG